MAVILGGWLWSFRYAIRIPATPESPGALADAYEQFRAAFGSIRSTAPSIVVNVPTAPSPQPAPATDAVLNTLKEKVIEAANE